MAERYNVIARIVSVQGVCSLGHKVGEEFLFADKTPAGLCMSAYNAIWPSARALIYGGEFPWASEPGTVRLVCPDPEVPVVFELRRVPREK